MAGMEVTKYQLDMKSSDAVLSLRSAFAKVESIAKWLANTPGSGASDPLVIEFGYTEDEAYLIRLVFGNFEAVHANNIDNFELARKLTGLE